MTLDPQITEQLIVAHETLCRVFADMIETVRATVLPELVRGIRANVYRVLTCPTCGRHYGVTLDEARALMCCGREVPTAMMEVHPGILVRHPGEDQFVAAPAIVEIQA